MLRAAHYKPEAVDSPSKSPSKHRAGGILDLALTAADKYALSLLPAGLKGTGLSGVDPTPQADARAGQPVTANAFSPSFKLHRGSGNAAMQSVPAQPAAGATQQAPADGRAVSSWDSSFKEILAALEPDNRTLKPAKLRDIKYPNQNHGMPATVSSPPARRELDDALVTLPRAPRRGKAAMPSYTSPAKGLSRHGRRPDVQGVDVQYDLVPSVKLAWAGSSAGGYHTAGYANSPKKYTSQLVGRVSPHYSGASPGNQEPVHLPDITGHGFSQSASHALAYVQQLTPTKPNHGSPAQPWSPGNATRRALPYVSASSPSLARPLTVQYHPVLKSSPSGGIGPASIQPPGTSPAAGWGSRLSPPHPGNDQAGAQYARVGSANDYGTHTSPRGQNGTPPHRLPPGPPEVAAEIARLRSQDLESTGSSDAANRQEYPVKSKFLQMYEDPSRPVASIDPKRLLADVLPSPRQQPGRKPPLPARGAASSASPASGGSGSAVGRSPMFERRLKPLPSSAAGEDSGNRPQADAAVSEGPDGASALAAEPSEAVSSAQPTPMSSVLEPEDTAALEVELAEDASRLAQEPCSPSTGLAQPRTETGSGPPAVGEAESQAAEAVALRDGPTTDAVQEQVAAQEATDPAAMQPPAPCESAASSIPNVDTAGAPQPSGSGSGDARGLPSILPEQEPSLSTAPQALVGEAPRAGSSVEAEASETAGPSQALPSTVPETAVASPAPQLEAATTVLEEAATMATQARQSTVTAVEIAAVEDALPQEAPGDSSEERPEAAAPLQQAASPEAAAGPEASSQQAADTVAEAAAGLVMPPAEATAEMPQATVRVSSPSADAATTPQDAAVDLAAPLMGESGEAASAAVPIPEATGVPLEEAEGPIGPSMAPMDAVSEVHAGAAAPSLGAPALAEPSACPVEASQEAASTIPAVDAAAPQAEVLESVPPSPDAAAAVAELASDMAAPSQEAVETTPEPVLEPAAAAPEAAAALPEAEPSIPSQEAAEAVQGVAGEPAAPLQEAADVISEPPAPSQEAEVTDGEPAAEPAAESTAPLQEAASTAPEPFAELMASSQEAELLPEPVAQPLGPSQELVQEPASVSAAPAQEAADPAPEPTVELSALSQEATDTVPEPAAAPVTTQEAADMPAESVAGLGAAPKEMEEPGAGEAVDSAGAATATDQQPDTNAAGVEDDGLALRDVPEQAEAQAVEAAPAPLPEPAAGASSPAGGEEGGVFPADGSAARAASDSGQRPDAVASSSDQVPEGAEQEAEPGDTGTAPASSDAPPEDTPPEAGGAAAAPEPADTTAAASGIAAAEGGVPVPPGVSPEDMHAAIVRIQSHARGYLARRQVAELRKGREAGQAALSAAVTAAAKVNAYELPPGVTPEMAEAAAVHIQTHARGYLARRRVALMRRGLKPSQDGAAATAPEAVPEFLLPPGVTPEMAEAAAIRVQAHMRGHLARRRVRQIRAANTAPAVVVERPGREGEDADMALREAGEAVSMGLGLDDPAAAAAAAAVPEDEEEAAAAAAGLGPVEPVEAEVTVTKVEEQEVVQELTVDALKAALADDEDDIAAAAAEPDADAATAAEAEAPAPVDMSDPAAVAAAAAAAAGAKGASRIFDENVDSVADTAAAADQAAAEEVSMARLAANSARTSAMFQGAGAEMRYSDDEASALELMDNLDGLLQGDDEAAAAAAAVAAAAAAAPAEGELVCISPHGVSEPQALRASGAGAVTNPMDVLEPGGVRVLASKYEVQHVVGEGAYGMVMKCKVRGTEPTQWVAIKEFKIDDNDPDAEDVKRTSLREVSVLEQLQHPHVVRFVDKFMVGDRLFIVMEFLPCNLLELLEAQPGGMDRDAVRLIMFQLCSAIAFIHSKGMIYRDIKPENLLVDESGTVKLCDFGFARYLPSGPASHLTDYVATRWYRAPELLLGPPYRDSTGKHIQYMYGPQVDMWAVGCLMGELLDGEPLFAGDSDLDQLYRVQQILGPMAPSHQYMFYANPHNTGIVFNIKQPVTLGSRYRGKVSDVELDFMSGLLEMDPDKRMTGQQCLQHPYLSDLAAAAQAIPTPGASLPTTPAAASSIDYLQPLVGTTPDPDASVDDSLLAPGALSTPRETTSEFGPGSFQTPPSRGLAVAQSLTRAAGSLTRRTESLPRTPGSVSRGMGSMGSMTRGGGTPIRGSYSPLPTLQLGSEPVRAGSLVQAHESGEVVIVEGVVEDADQQAQGVALVQPLVSIGEITAVAG